jgi:hypothetical protein
VTTVLQNVNLLVCAALAVVGKKEIVIDLHKTINEIKTVLSQQLVT